LAGGSGFQVRGCRHQVRGCRHQGYLLLCWYISKHSAEHSLCTSQAGGLRS
jgi:hypothetical protein